MKPVRVLLSSLGALVGVSLAVATQLTLLATGQVSSQVTKMLVKAAPKLEVKEFSGDFAQWGLTGTLSKGSLTSEFRWSTTSKGFARERYEVSLSAFPAPANYQEAFNLKASSVLPPPSQPGAANSFHVDFKPLLQEIFGTSEPKESATFYVRLVLLNSQNKALSPVSQTIRILYSPPGGGTRLDRAMYLYLKSIRCITQTSGPGSDDIDVNIVGARISQTGLVKGLYSGGWDDIDDDWAVFPSQLLWDYSGLGLDAKFFVLVALREEDIDGFSVAGSIANGSSQAVLVSHLSKSFCEVEDVQCLGSPQILPVTQADFNKVALNDQMVTKTLTFQGDGGRYEIAFELRPK